MTAAGAEVGSERVMISPEAIMLELRAIRELLEPLRPLIPHVPAAVALLDNPAARWKLRGAGRRG
jgi:hypothetical protein